MESDSCNNVSSCVSVGFYYAIDPASSNWYYEGIIDTLIGRSWQSAVAPLPPNAAKTTDGLTVASFLYSVSCSSPGACTAVGTYRDALDREGVDSGVDLILAGTPDNILEGLAEYADAGTTDLRIMISARTEEERLATREFLAASLGSAS